MAGTRTSEAASGTTLRIGLIEPIDSLNPFMGVTDNAYLFWQFIYEDLITVDEDMNPKPNLATSWYAVPEYEPLGSVWQYNLTRNATWHDNEPFDADDVVFTIQMQTGINFDTVWAYQPSTALIDSIEKIDEFTVRIHYKDLQGNPSHVPFAESLMIPIIPKHIWGQMDVSGMAFDFENLWPIGTGPFMCTKYTKDEYKSGDPLILLKNPDYHGAIERGDTIDFDRVILVFYLEPSAMFTDIQRGAIDVAAFNAASFQNLEAWLISNPTAPIETYSGLQCTGFSVELGICMQPNTLNNLRRDPAVIKAMAYATNKEFIKNSIYRGYAETGSTIISPVYGDLYWAPSPEDAYTFDLAKANQTLDDAGYYWGSDGIRRAGVGNAYGFEGTKLMFEIIVEQELMEDRDTATKLREDFRKVGIQIEPRYVSIGLWSKLIYGYSYELTLTYWSGDPDPSYLLYTQTSYCIEDWSENGYENPRYDENYSRYIKATTHEEKKAAIHNCQKLMYEDAAFIVTTYPYGCWGWRTDSFSGWGDWGAHPGRQLANFWSANQLYFDLVPLRDDDTSSLVLYGAIAAGVVAAVVVAAWFIRRRGGEKEEDVRLP
jgi:peptide/nickel transport system substrate-binding protein